MLRTFSFQPKFKPSPLFRFLSTSTPSSPILNLLPTWLELSNVHPTQPQLISKFHYVWLRDHCLCPLCKHASSGQKLHQSGSIPNTLHPISVEYLDSPSRIQIEWPPHSLGATKNEKEQIQHTSVFPFSFLRQWDYSQPTLQSSYLHSFPNIEPWSASTLSKLPEFTYQASDLLTQKSLLLDLARVGIVKVKNVPLGQLKSFTETWIGSLRTTFYGPIWQVYNDPKTTNIASTTLDLPLHMDLMYFENPPFLQLIQYEQQSNEKEGGGESTFLDLAYFWDRFQHTHPDSAHFLTHTYMTFYYDSKTQKRGFQHPFYAQSKYMCPPFPYFAYAPPFQGPTFLPFTQMTSWYHHMSIFEKELAKMKVYEEKIEIGDIVIFQNRRVLHGRKGYKGDKRKISGCYVDLDEFASTFRKLSSQENRFA